MSDGFDSLQVIRHMGFRDALSGTGEMSIKVQKINRKCQILSKFIQEFDDKTHEVTLGAEASNLSCTFPPVL